MEKRKPSLGHYKATEPLKLMACLAAAGVVMLLSGVGPLLLLGWVTIFIVPSTYLLVILPHELGHLAAARLVGFRPVLLVVGCFWARFVGPHPRIGVSPIAFGGGYVMCRPSNKPSRAAIITYLLGGVAANIAVFVLAADLLLITARHVSYDAGPFDVNLIVVAILAGVLYPTAKGIVVSLHPRRYSSSLTDGARVLRALRSESSVAVTYRQMTFSTQSDFGIRPRDWSAAECEWLIEHALDDVERAHHTHEAIWLWMDRGDIEAAERYLESGLKLVADDTTIMRELIYLDAGFFHAFYKRDHEKASKFAYDSWLVVNDPSAKLFMAAALAYARGDFGAARRDATKYLTRLNSGTSVPGYRLAVSDFMRAIATAEEGLTETAVQYEPA